MGTIFLFGLVFASVSNAAHFGGFLGGILIGILCAPTYRKSYSMRRKWSVDVDYSTKDYRQAMGFGVKPTAAGLIPLPLLWAAILLFLSTRAKFRAVPSLLLQGLLRPGSLTKTTTTMP